MCQSRDQIPIEWLKLRYPITAASIIEHYQRLWDAAHEHDAKCYACKETFQWTGPSTWKSDYWYIHKCGAWNEEEGSKRRFKTDADL